MWQYAVSEPSREGTPMDLFANSEGLVSEVMAGGLPGHSDHKMMEILVVGKLRRRVSRVATLDFQNTDFGLFRRLAGKIP